MRFTAIYPTSKNFTPYDLMRNHAKLVNGFTFHTDHYFTPYLLFAGTRYYFDHWEIENGSNDGSICVTVYLKEKTNYQPPQQKQTFAETIGEQLSIFDLFKEISI